MLVLRLPLSALYSLRSARSPDRRPFGPCGVGIAFFELSAERLHLGGIVARALLRDVCTVERFGARGRIGILLDDLLELVARRRPVLAIDRKKPQPELDLAEQLVTRKK